MNADRFWHKPGIVAGLERHGLEVLAPDRLLRAPDWAAEAEHLTKTLPDQAVAVVAESNGCSTAVQLALTHPERVECLLLGWPATVGDQEADAHNRDSMTGQGASRQVIDALLAGETLRGVADAEMSAITQPVGVVPSLPENVVHRRHTVDALLRVLPHAAELPACPEPPRPTFASYVDDFIHTVVRFSGDQ